MARSNQRRSILAALLSFVQPGLGHLYLRAWLRAALWFGMWAGALGLAVTTSEVALSAGDLLVVALGLFAAADGVTLEVIVALYAMKLFATLDAYWLADRRDRRRDDGPPRCPHCRKDLDPSLDFCHWCTASLENEDLA